MKYVWLDFSDYLAFETLKNAVEHILVDIGGKYRINFT